MQPACHLFLHGFVHLLPTSGLAVNHDTDSRGLEDRVQGDGCPRPVLSSVRGRWTGGGRVPSQRRHLGVRFKAAAALARVCICVCV